MAIDSATERFAMIGFRAGVRHKLFPPTGSAFDSKTERGIMLRRYTSDQAIVPPTVTGSKSRHLRFTFRF